MGFQARLFGKAMRCARMVLMDLRCLNHIVFTSQNGEPLKCGWFHNRVTMFRTIWTPAEEFMSRFEREVKNLQEENGKNKMQEASLTDVSEVPNPNQQTFEAAILEMCKTCDDTPADTMTQDFAGQSSYILSCLMSIKETNQNYARIIVQ